MYLPLEYVKRYSVLTELYCSEEYINCEPEVLLEMIADADWGTSNYSGCLLYTSPSPRDA